MPTISKIGFCKYKGKLPIEDESTGKLKIPIDVQQSRGVQFSFDYNWTGNNCTIKNIKWHAARIIPNEITGEREVYTNLGLGRAPNDEQHPNAEIGAVVEGEDQYCQSNKITFSFGDTQSNTTTYTPTTNGKNKISEPSQDLYNFGNGPTITTSSRYTLANFKYSFIPENRSEEDPDYIEYLVEIKNIKIPKPSKYDQNLVFTQAGLNELIQEIKNWPYSDTSVGSNSNKQLRRGIEIPATNIINLGKDGLDLNDYILPGRYYVASGDDLYYDQAHENIRIQNSPVLNAGFTLDVFGNYSNGWIIQVITSATRDIYYRVRYGRYEQATSYINGRTYYKLVNGIYTIDNTVSASTNFSTNTYYLYEYGLRDWEKVATARNLTEINHDLKIDSKDGTTTGNNYGITRLYLGNNKIFREGQPDATPAIQELKEDQNSRGQLNIYGRESSRHIIYSSLTDANANTDQNRIVYFQDFNGNQYLTHTGSTDAVGSSTRPVYVDNYGRITACNFTMPEINDNAKLKYLHVTSSKTLEWAEADALPAQSNNTNGQYLKSENGVAKWASVEALPSGGTTGKFLRGDKAWSNELVGPIKISSATGANGNTIPTPATPGSNAGADFWCTGAGYFGRNLTAAKVFNAVFNDYAEYRITINLTPGHVVVDNDNGSLACSSARLQPGAQVISDTFGHSMGETENAKTPLAVAGRVLVYTYQPRENYHAGMAVCSAPDGTVDIMTREEIRDYPDCIIGIVSEIPQYETWGSDNVKVDGRIWIKVK